MDTTDHLAAGQAALNTADWQAAKAHYEAALLQAETAEAHDGLGIALWWLNEIGAAHEQRTMAFVAFKQRGDFHRAGLLAAWLAREQVFLYSNTSAMNGWFARAERLLGQAAPCPEKGWFLTWRASMLESPAQLEQTATNVIDIARAFSDTALEMIGLAFRGLALVTLRRIADGIACLDEAMTMATSGETVDFMATSETFCLTLSACELAGDLVRCEQWCQVATAFANRYHCPFLSAYCRTTYGSMLLVSGQWQQAETTLIDAVRLFHEGHRGLRFPAVLKLAELRISQGKLEEAEVLLTGFEDSGAAVVPLARLHLARKEHEKAWVILDQALKTSEPATLHRVPVLSLFAEVSLLRDNLEAAQQAVRELTQIANATHSDLLLAQAELAEGRIKRHTGDADAETNFHAALRRLQLQEQSLLAGRTRFEMAQTLVGRDPVGAITWARAALATFERIGAKDDANQAASLLRQLGERVRTGPHSQEVLSAREAEVLQLLARGYTNRAIAERLVISAKTVEHHVSQILGKLGLRSRAEAAAYAVGRHPDSESYWNK